MFRTQLPLPEIRSIALDLIERKRDRNIRPDIFKETARIIVMTIILSTPPLSVIFLTNTHEKADSCNTTEYFRRNITIIAIVTVIIRVNRYCYQENVPVTQLIKKRLAMSVAKPAIFKPPLISKVSLLCKFVRFSHGIRS